MRGLLLVVVGALWVAACDGGVPASDEPADGGVVWCNPHPQPGDAGVLYFAACSDGDRDPATQRWQLNCAFDVTGDAGPLGREPPRCDSPHSTPTACSDGVTPIRCVPYPYCPDTVDHACDGGAP